MLDRLSAEAAAAGLTSQPTGGGGTVSRTVAASGGSEAWALGDGSTHWLDRQRIVVCRGTEKGVENTQRLSSSNNSGRLEKEREQWYEQLAVRLAEGSIRESKLTRDEYNGVMAMQKRAERGKCGETGEKEAAEKEDSSVGVVMDERDRGNVRARFQAGFEEVEKGEGEEKEHFDVGQSSKGTTEGARENVGLWETEPAREGVNIPKRPGTTSERNMVPLRGEERYAEQEWAVARLRKSDGYACVGIKTPSGRCDVTDFKMQRVGGSVQVSVLVLYK